MARILVTGGAGFIGAHLCDSLVKAGHHVTCIDNLVTGSESNISPLLSNRNFKFIKADVKGQLPALETEFIFHLASRASPVDFARYPTDILMTNAVGTQNALNLARENGSKFLLASTSESYGDPLQHPQKETYWGNVNPVGPRGCYDEAKRFAEALTMAFLREHKVDVRIVRIFNTYGPRMQKEDGRVIPNFITQCLQNKPVTLYGEGRQTRSFCYVSDMVCGIEKAMFSERTKGEVFNIGNPKETSIIELAKLITKLSASSSEVTFKPLPQDDPARRNPDIGKARSTIGWEPQVGLEEGLKRTITYFRELK